MTPHVKKKKNHYVNNKALYEEMLRYKAQKTAALAAGKEAPRLSNFVGECILLICNRIATRPNFSGYSYRDEMVDDAVENCLKAAASFDPDKSNSPFNYLSTTAMRAMIRRISEEKKQSYLKHKIGQARRLHVSPEQLGQPNGSDFEEKSDRVISDFEEKLRAKKQKKKDAQPASGVELFMDGE